MKLLKSIALASVLAAVGFSTAKAVPLAITDSRYLGSIVPGTPASEAQEAAYINKLMTLSVSTSLSVDHGSNPVTTTGVGQQVVLTHSGNAIPQMAIGALEWDKQDDGTLLSEDVTGWNYLLLKYGQDSYVWYVGGLTGKLELSNKLVLGEEWNTTGPPAQRETYLVPVLSGGLSNSIRFGSSTTSVPDAGGTLVLLGAVVGLLGLIRRKIN